MLPTLIEDYNEILLDLQIFGIMASRKRPTLEQLKEQFFNEFNKEKPMPSLLSKRYELSEKVSDNYQINTSDEVELSQKESLVNLQDSQTFNNKIKYADEQIVAPNMAELFTYESQVNDSIRSEILNKYNISTGEMLQLPAEQVIKTFASVKEDTSLITEDTTLEDGVSVIYGEDATYTQINTEKAITPDNGVESSVGVLTRQTDNDNVTDDGFYEEFEDRASSDFNRTNSDFGADETDSQVGNSPEFNRLEEDDYGEEDSEDALEDDYGEDEDSEAEGDYSEDSEDDYGDEEDDYGDYEDEDENSEDSEKLDNETSESKSPNPDDNYYDGDEDETSDEGYDEDDYGDEEDDYGDYEDEDETSEDEEELNNETSESKSPNSDSNYYSGDEEETSEDDYGDDEEAGNENSDFGTSDSDDDYGDEDNYDESEDDYGESEDEDDYGESEDEDDYSEVNTKSISHKEDIPVPKTQVLPPKNLVPPHKTEPSKYDFDVDITDEELDKIIQTGVSTQFNIPKTPAEIMAKAPPREEQVDRSQEPTDLRMFLRKHPKCTMNFILKYFSQKEINDALKKGKIMKKNNYIRLS